MTKLKMQNSSTSAVPTCIADPKAISARRYGGKIVQNISAKSDRSTANEWRREHGLEMNKPMRKKGVLA